MACIVIELPNGVRFTHPENTPRSYIPGERIVDIDRLCNGVVQTTIDELENHGLQLGDAVAWVTKRLGIKQCAPCKARQEIFNHVSENGWAETLRQIKATI